MGGPTGCQFLEMSFPIRWHMDECQAGSRKSLCIGPRSERKIQGTADLGPGLLDLS